MTPELRAKWLTKDEREWCDYYPTGAAIIDRLLGELESREREDKTVLADLAAEAEARGWHCKARSPTPAVGAGRAGRGRSDAGVAREEDATRGGGHDG